MPKRGVRRERGRGRTIARIAVLIAILAIYSAYWVLTPTVVEVANIEASTADLKVMKVTLHNPTFKVITGAILRVEAEVDVPNGRGGTTVLQSIPAEYQFTLFPQSSQEVGVPLNFRVIPRFEYDITLQINGVGQRTFTMLLRES